MKKTIPFDLFGAKENLRFTILSIAELEEVIGKSIQQIVQSQNAGIGFCLKALPICLKRINPHLYVEKIEKYLSEDGRTIDDIAIPIIHAICASGALGTTYQKNALRIYYPDLYPEEKEDETEKNE
jgi:hypothetical protein